MSKTSGVQQAVATGPAARANLTLPTIDWSARDALEQRKKALATLPPVSIRFGSKNDQVAVKRIQTALKARGLYQGAIDGRVTAETDAAIRAFQRAKGLRGDGDIGNATYTALMGGSGSQLPPAGYNMLDTSMFTSGELKGFEGSPRDFSEQYDPAAANLISLGNNPDAHQVRLALRQLATSMGLTITSQFRGRDHHLWTLTSLHGEKDHAGTSIAFDAAGTPEAQARFAVAAKDLIDRAGFTAAEIFYDPLGGIKNGRQIGAIGGHGDHVHVAV